MKRGPIPAEPSPKWLRPVIDTREQSPWEFPNLGEPIVKTVNVADYTYLFGEHLFRVERKSGPDYLSSLFTERFDKEMQLIKAFPTHALIIEGSWEWLESGVYRINASAKSVTGKTLGYIESGVNVILAGTRERAQTICERLMYMSARRRWRELHGMLSGMTAEAELEEAPTA